MTLTDRQLRWFASVREGLERETGRSLAEWAVLAKACPERRPAKRLAWMKATHGLAQNRAMMVLKAAFPEIEEAEAVLWADPAAQAIHAAVRALVLALPDVIVGQRKGFTAYSRNFQFCAARPWKDGVAVGLAVPPSGALAPAARDGWSERLLCRAVLRSPEEAAPLLAAFLRQAWEHS